MCLKEFENRIREIGEIASDLAENIDCRQAHFESLVPELSRRAIEEFRNVGTAGQFGLRRRGAGLLHFGCKFAPSQGRSDQRSQREPQISDDLRDEHPCLHAGN